jgi:hypothetical protein
MNDLTWSPGEKAAARKAFDLALKRELDEVIRKTKERAAKIQEPSDLWKLEDYLTERRKEIDTKYDYRYSVLLWVFIRVRQEGRLTEEELQGLSQDKLDRIRRGMGVL